MSAEIRQITIDTMLKHYAPMHRYAFFSSPPMDLSNYEKQIPLYRDATIMGMFEGDEAVATALSLPMTQNVRGKVLSMGGVAGVTSKPTTRRKGYVKQLMLDLFSSMHAQGHAVSALYPFRESFYQRLGYTLFTNIKAITFKTSDMKPILDMPLAGSVEYVNQQDGWDIARDMLHDMQQVTHGMAVFSPEPLKHLYGSDDLWLAIARDDEGTVIGTMAYKITNFFGAFAVSRFFAKNSLARYLLLQFIAKHVYQVHDVQIKNLSPTASPETWFSDLSIKADPDIWLTPMGRILDIRRLDGIPIGTGTITIHVNDPFCAWNNGIFTLASVDGKLHISEGGTADCTLTIQGLSALVYGSHHLDDFQWRGWGTLSDEHIATLSQMFPPASPFLLASF
ncbi:MAG: GNAT family N-acetyltransferase [Phototrophicaceae bacterium]